MTVTKTLIVLLAVSAGLAACTAVPKDISLQGHTKFALSLPTEEVRYSIFSPLVSGGVLDGWIPKMIDESIKDTNQRRSKAYTLLVDSLPTKVSLREVFNAELLRQLKAQNVEVTLVPGPKSEIAGGKAQKSWNEQEIKERFVIQLFDLHAMYFATTSVSNFEPVVSIIYGTYDVDRKTAFPGTNFEVRSADQSYSYSKAQDIASNPEKSLEGLRRTTLELARVVAEKLKRAK